MYASSPEEQHKLAESIRTQDLVISARLDKGRRRTAHLRRAHLGHLL